MLNEASKAYYAQNQEIGETDYSYGLGTVFGEGIYTYIKDECEKAAKDRNIPIVWVETNWVDSIPEGDDFINLCDEVLKKHGGIINLGSRERTEDITDVSVGRKTIQRVINYANKKGYHTIAERIKKIDYGKIL